MRLLTCFVLTVLSVCLCGSVYAAPDAIACWPLTEDASDVSGNGRHAENHGVEFGKRLPDGSRAAHFDGRSAYLEVPAGAAPEFGAEEFTLSMWVYTENILDDGLGDLFSKYDPATRTGVNLGILTCSGVSNSQPNYRTVHFGIDNGKIEDRWADCGRPGNAVFIFGFAVHDGNLYAATCEPGEKEAGHVYRYLGGADWEDCGSPGPANSVGALAVHEGSLYAATSWYDTTGSALAASANTAAGGQICRYAGGTDWQYCGRLENPETGEAITVGGLTVFRGNLYATTLKQGGFGLYRHERDTEWVYCGNPGCRVLNPGVFNGGLYMVSYDAPGGPYRYDGANWAYVGGSINPPIDQDYCFAVYDGLLHVSTWPKAYVYRMDDGGQWTPCGRPADELETMGMMAYNGKLYAGTLPAARVFRYDGADMWTPVGQQLDTAEGKYRRVWSMAVFKGRLFCGTLPSGRVFSIEAGKNVTLDDALKPGWRHIAAVREHGRLSLYVDGSLAGESTEFDSSLYDLTGNQPLRIGFGAADHFNGWMKDVKVFDRALSVEALRAEYGGTECRSKDAIAATPDSPVHTAQ